jgi:hypothetical protein
VQLERGKSLMVPLHMRSELRGVQQVTSLQVQHFSPAQLQLLQLVACWVGSSPTSTLPEEKRRE